jgi:hypothetical protein
MLVCRENAFSNTLLKLHISSFDNEGVNSNFYFNNLFCKIFLFVNLLINLE